MDIGPPVTTGLYFVLLGHNVSVPDILRTVETEIRLFVVLGGPVGIWWDGAVLKEEALFSGFCKEAGGGRKGSEMGEGGVAWRG